MKEKEFIQEHFNDQIDKLLLSASKYPDINMNYVAEQIMARRNIKDKLPGWYENWDIIFPSQIATEQASSEITGRYKQQLIKGNSICDMTGGMGVDVSFFSEVAKEVVYMERFEHYAKCAEHNFNVLGRNNIRVLNGDSLELVHLIKADTIYIDPARRGNGNKRLFALTECEPDVVNLVPKLLPNVQRVVIKVSPMADISECIRSMPEIKEVHVVSVKNECKELLLIIDSEESINSNGVTIVCYNYTRNGEEIFKFNWKEEQNSTAAFSTQIGNYIYEPNSSILKAGAFKSITSQLAVTKLHQHSHLYTSNDIVSNFPGRTFKVSEIMEANSRCYKEIGRQFPQANITVRNFPITVAEIRKKTKIKEGGEVYIFATTLIDNRRYFIVGHK